MIDIIKRGSTKKFIIVCAECITTFTYEKRDTFTEERFNIYKSIRCPVCGEELEATFKEFVI